MKNLTKIAIGLAAAGGICYVMKDKIKTTRAYQTVESNETVKKAKTTAENTWGKVRESDAVKKFKENENVKKAKAVAEDTWDKVKDSETVQKVKTSASDAWDKVKDSETVQKAKDTVSDKYDKLKDTIKDKLDSQQGDDREYFTLDDAADETSAAKAADDTSDETPAAEAADSVSDETSAAEDDDSEDITVESPNITSVSDIIGDEYMGLSDVSEDPTVLAEQDKLD